MRCHVLNAGASLGPSLRRWREERMNRDSPAKAQVSSILLGHLVESEILNLWARVTLRLDFMVSWRNKTAANCFAWNCCWSFFFSKSVLKM